MISINNEYKKKNKKIRKTPLSTFRENGQRQKNLSYLQEDFWPLHIDTDILIAAAAVPSRWGQEQRDHQVHREILPESRLLQVPKVYLPAGHEGILVNGRHQAVVVHNPVHAPDEAGREGHGDRDTVPVFIGTLRHRLVLRLIDGWRQSVRIFAILRQGADVAAGLGRVDAVVQLGDLAEEDVPGEDVGIDHGLLVLDHQGQDEEGQSEGDQTGQEDHQRGLGVGAEGPEHHVAAAAVPDLGQLARTSIDVCCDQGLVGSG